MTASSDDDEPLRGYASPPCYAAEIAPDYFGLPPEDPQQACDVARWRRAERERLRAMRLEIPADVRSTMAQALAGHLDALIARRLGDVAGHVVSVYWPIKAEFDLRFWMGALHDRGARVALPVVETRKAPLVFRAWKPGAAMERGHWNIPVPATSSPLLIPEVTLAPVVGWDGEGYRLGYGGGYFDRTLAALSSRPFVIGIGSQAARIPTIFPQPHDIPMDAIVTEAGVQWEAGV